MFDKILIANRGEIACRVIRTARRLGIASVAVYSDADRLALHAAMADEAVRIGPPAAAESYLDIKKVIQAAKDTGAQAIHPGYGFLSENAKFAEACKRAGIVFIGPPGKAIRAMGSKSAAKAIMEKAKVPLVPGYHGEEQGPKLLAKEADRIGYPVMIKASAGGGGKGMRVVESAKAFGAALESARREASASFGDARVLVEKYLERPRHIEVQVFADQAGNTVYLFERECSIQRRHQKVVEEAPAPGMEPARRAEMGAAAVQAAKAIGYVGAGTVEFIADQDGSFYFMEMNTRLQVEHPVTEFISGRDLVEWQLRVAAGEPLPAQQDDLFISGHAIEVRIYAEDPGRDFLPATGRLDHLRFPAETAHVRVDTGVREGDEVSIHYDPMIAKLVVWDETRAAAVRRMRTALAATEVVGLSSNVDFLSAVVAHPAFADGALDTGFIDRHRADLLPEAGSASDQALALAALYLLLARAAEIARTIGSNGDPYSPWNTTDGWRLNDEGLQEYRFQDGAIEQRVRVHFAAGGQEVELPSGRVGIAGDLADDGTLRADIGGERLTARVVQRGRSLTVFCRGRSQLLILHDPLIEATEHEGAAGRLTAPMPGKVIDVKVKSGARVVAGDTLMVLEAMKMEHGITAPADGTVTTVNYGVGDQVEEGAELLAFESGE
ncbi:MAG: acetyl/propionyl/methylcrotonyl-CoA carboxylase subunit alpha [Alphaproteobacteria bacterium]|nr:acetyl/propionyl/methylcrotonyl-CoA carboxylase subunit alpha [Alphaproteobacteria bacterium]